MTNVKHYPVGTLAPDTTPHYRVTIWLPSGPLELTSTTQPQRLETGEITGTWLDHPRHGTMLSVNWALVPMVTWKEAKPGGGLA